MTGARSTRHANAHVQWLLRGARVQTDLEQRAAVAVGFSRQHTIDEPDYALQRDSLLLVAAPGLPTSRPQPFNKRCRACAVPPPFDAREEHCHPDGVDD
jgi:hypothetical protein